MCELLQTKKGVQDPKYEAHSTYNSRGNVIVNTDFVTYWENGFCR